MKKWHTILLSLFFLFHIMAVHLFAEKSKTTIRIENTGETVKLYVNSSEKLLYRIEHLRQALALYISPVEKDPEVPREFPVNNGLVKKIKFIQQKDRELLIAIDVISLPQYYIKEIDDKKGLALIILREMFGSPRRTQKEKFYSKIPEIEVPRSPRMKKIATLLNSARSDTLHAAQPPMEIVPKGRLRMSFSIFFDVTKGGSLKSTKPPMENAKDTSLKDNLFLVIDATRSSLPEGFKTSNVKHGNNAVDRKELINREFVKTELVQILKFLSNKLGLNLITSPHIRGSKSIVLNEITAEEAIPLVLKGTDYTYRVCGNFLLVGPADIIETLSLNTSPYHNVEEVIRVFVFKHKRIEKIVPQLEKEFPNIRVEQKKTLNALIITTESFQMEKIERFLQKLDKP